MGCEVGVATTPEVEEEEVRKQRILPKLLNTCSVINKIVFMIMGWWSSLGMK